MDKQKFEPNNIRRIIVEKYGKITNQKIGDQSLVDIEVFLSQEEMTRFKQEIYAYYGLKYVIDKNGIREHHDRSRFLVKLWDEIIKSQDK